MFPSSVEAVQLTSNVEVVSPSTVKLPGTLGTIVSVAAVSWREVVVSNGVTFRLSKVNLSGAAG